MKKLLIYGVIVVVVVMFWDKIKAAATGIINKAKSATGTTPAA